MKGDGSPATTAVQQVQANDKMENNLDNDNEINKSIKANVIRQKDGIRKSLPGAITVCVTGV